MGCRRSGRKHGNTGQISGGTKNMRPGKNPGSVLDILSVLVMVIALSILMLAYLESMRMLELKEEISQISRRYILKMETLGCLSPEDMTDMVQALSDLGLENIDLSGTTMLDAGYGNPVTLSIQGKLQGRELAGNDLMEMLFRGTEWPVEINRMSTAKN